MSYIRTPGRQQRSFAGRAPILENDEVEVERKSYTVKPMKKVTWKPDQYSRQLFNHMFIKWGVEE